MRIILTLFCFSLLLFNSISHSTIRRYRRHHKSNYNKKNVKVLKNYLHKLRKMNQHYEENKKWVE
jgi:hypothetical protein